MRVVASALALVLCSVPIHAANTLPQAFTCGQQGVAGGLGAGTDLTRYTIDVTRFPLAVCNDGTPAVFYYAPSSKPEDHDKWIIFLQGGGSCVDGQSCAQRWCSVDTNYGLDKMSTSLSKPQIRGNGFMNPAPQNRFGSWNRVLIYYCSSDAWSGTTTRTVSASLNSVSRDYDIHFHGAHIVDAVIDTLRNASTGRRHVARHDVWTAATPVAALASTAGRAATDVAAVQTPWPDLDHATAVLFAGSSAGGAGVRANVDRVGAKLRATNPNLDYRGLIDAIYSTLGENLNFATTTYCANDPVHGCSYETYTQAVHERVDVGLWGSAGDASCLQWHATHEPGTEWRCSDGDHVNLHHITTPFFLRQDLQDTNIGGDWVEAGYGGPSDYAMHVEAELRNLPVPEETQGATPGLFVPQCTDHESFTNDERVYDVKITGVNFHDAVANWWAHTQPQQLIRHFTGTPGKAPECP
jgi:hypothetical protein